MFEGLNAIPWTYLTHAYGSAEEVPMWLRQLRSDEPALRHRAMNDLAGSICHQDWISPASGYAVSFLIELLQIPGPQNRGEILELLADIADADPLDEDTWRKNHRVSVWNVPAHIQFKNAHAEALKGLPIYLSLLHDPDPQVRVEAAYVLTPFPECAFESVPALRRALADEVDPWVRAGFLRSLGALASKTTDASQFFAEAMRTASSDLERFAAAVQWVVAAPDDASDEAVAVVARGWERSNEQLQRYQHLPRTPTAFGTASWALEHVNPARLRFAIPVLKTEFLAATSNITAHFATEPLLTIVFEGGPRKSRVPQQNEKFTPDQREVLTLLLERDDLWRLGNFTSLVDAYGLPSERKAMATFLGCDLPEARPKPVSSVSPWGAARQQMEMLKRLFPDMQVRQVESRSTRPGEAVVLNKKIRVRFALTERARDEMRVEVALLKALDGQLPVPISES